jgi:prepilin-type N-terminal cleavage/methylation domain-containing protein
MNQTRRAPSSGFTLIEMLVAIAVFTILMIGLLNLLDSSTRVSKIEASLADTQENVRYATYHLMRTARMMGGSILPFARGGGSGNAWAAGEVRNNVGNTQTIFGTGVNTMAGSDVLILRGFFDVAPFFISQTDVNVTASQVTIREHTGPTGSERVINDLTPFQGASAGLQNRGIILATGEGWTQVSLGARVGGQYVVGMVNNDAAVAGTSPNRTLTLEYVANANWDVLNVDGTAVTSADPTFRASRAGILEAFAYYVDSEMVLRRISGQNPGIGEPVAVNIGGLQVELGVDANGDDFLDPGTEWVATPTLVGALAGNGVVAMRLTVLGRTPFEVMDWTEPATTFVGAGDMTVPTAGTSGPRHAKWRRMEVAVALRNFM